MNARDEAKGRSSLDSEAVTARERYIRVAAIDITTTEKCWNTYWRGIRTPPLDTKQERTVLSESGICGRNEVRLPSLIY